MVFNYSKAELGRGLKLRALSEKESYVHTYMEFRLLNNLLSYFCRTLGLSVITKESYAFQTFKQLTTYFCK